MTREELLSKIHRHSRSEDFRQAKMDKYTNVLFQSCREEEAKNWATPMLQQQEVEAMFPGGWWPTLACSSEQASGKLRRIDDAKRGMSERTARYEEKVQLPTAIQPAGTARWHCDGQRCRAPQDSEGTAAEVFEHGGEDLPDAYRGLVDAEKDRAATCWDKAPPGWYHLFQLCRRYCSSIVLV